MNPSDISEPNVDATTREVVGLNSYLSRVEPGSEKARERWHQLACSEFRCPDVVRGQLERLRKLDETLSDEQIAELTDQLGRLPTLERPVRRLDAGETLRDADFFELKRFLYHADSLLETADGVDDLPRRDSAVAAVVAEAMETLHPGHGRSARFHLADELDAELAEQRKRLRRVRRRLRTRRQSLEQEIIDEYGGQFDIHGYYRPDSQQPDLDEAPLKLSDRRRVLDDEELDELQQRHDRRQQAVRRIEDEQRRRLTRYIEGIRDQIQRLEDQLVELDLRLARVKLRRSVDGCWPRLADDPQRSEKRWLEINEGRDPRVAESTDADALQPVGVELLEPGAVVLGPNMGGKSALLRLIGLASWCAQMALPVPARRCRAAAVERIVYIGSEEPGPRQSNSGLSSFGREIRRFVRFWNTGRCLWLLDEPCRGTHPEEGSRLAAAIARRRIEAGDRVVVATHFPDLARRCGFTRLRTGGLHADRQTLESAIAEAQHQGHGLHETLQQFMDYRIHEAPEGTVPRDGWRIARALGLEIPPPDHDC